MRAPPRQELIAAETRQFGSFEAALVLDPPLKALAHSCARLLRACLRGKDTRMSPSLIDRGPQDLDALRSRAIEEERQLLA